MSGRAILATVNVARRFCSMNYIGQLDHVVNPWVSVDLTVVSRPDLYARCLMSLLPRILNCTLNPRMRILAHASLGSTATCAIAHSPYCSSRRALAAPPPLPSAAAARRRAAAGINWPSAAPPLSGSRSCVASPPAHCLLSACVRACMCIMC